ncbi:hypothetical protein [Actinomadura litoris]|uniref:Uncharacterized protein n=1 Tax=Actinomadura litoris TaxID=2678616 RepID=A0A7K1KVA2_9ACTN|nr:hypothetical protein [Actinomadura litoris]MUN36073.1 hypothetical protein [Actinomadura litoris]
MRARGKITTTALIVLTAAGLAATTAAAAPEAGAPGPSRAQAAKPDPRVTGTAQKTGVAAGIAQTNCYSGVSDGAILAWHGAPVNASQPVVASVTEGFLGAEFIGDARLSIENLQTMKGLILVRVRTGWGSPLNVCLHFVG